MHRGCTKQELFYAWEFYLEEYEEYVYNMAYYLYLFDVLRNEGNRILRCEITRDYMGGGRPSECYDEAPGKRKTEALSLNIIHPLMS